MNKHDPIYSLACGTAPITFVERDGACSVVTGNTTTGTVAARSPISIARRAKIADLPGPRAFACAGDIFHFATRFGGNDFEIVEFCLCLSSEHPNDGPRVTKPTGSSES